MNILVTGGAGFIGSHVVDALVASGHEPAVIDTYATGRPENVQPGVERIEASIADAAAVTEAFERSRPEVVVHCAASYRDPDDWEEDVRTNVLGTVNVVRAGERAGVRRLIYLQTALCYGNRPLEQPITLDHPLRPESSYAISKTAGEQYIGESGLEFLSFRLANVYGPRNLSGPIPTFYKRITEGLECFAVDTRRDFVYVEDLVGLMLRAIAGDGAPGYYHVSSGADTAIVDLYREVAAVLGTDRECEERQRGPDDAATILLDPSRTEEEFGWRATTSLASGIRRTIESYGEHGVQETYTHLRMKT